MSRELGEQSATMCLPAGVNCLLQRSPYCSAVFRPSPRGFSPFRRLQLSRELSLRQKTGQCNIFSIPSRPTADTFIHPPWGFVTRVPPTFQILVVNLLKSLVLTTCVVPTQHCTEKKSCKIIFKSTVEAALRCNVSASGFKLVLNVSLSPLYAILASFSRTLS